MALNLASPGILIREVDLTIGRIDGTTGKVGGIVGSFEKGPVGEPTVVTGENDLFDQFGQPYNTDKQFEPWLVASSYLSYGGTLSVVRADDFNSTTGVGLKNAFDKTDATAPDNVSTASSIRILSSENYQELGYQENVLTGVTVAAKNPGTWADGIRIAIIDGQADQRITLTGTSGLSVGLGVTQGITVTDPASGSLTGHLKGIITGINDKDIDVKVVGIVTTGGETAKDYNSLYKFTTGGLDFPNSGAGTTSANMSRAFGGTTAASHNAGASINSFFKTGSKVLDEQGGEPLASGATEIGVETTGISAGANKFLVIGSEIISLNGATVASGKITGVTRGQQGTSAAAHDDGTPITLLDLNTSVGTVKVNIDDSATNVQIEATTDISDKVNAGGFLKIGTELLSVSAFFNGQSGAFDATAVVDWFDQQQYEVTTGIGTTVVKADWNAIADRPGTSEYVSDRGGRFDEVHIVVIDAKGKVTGNAGTILEKHLNLSKAKDAKFSAGSPSYWRSYLYTNSKNLFGLSGSGIGNIVTGFDGANFTPNTAGEWDKDAEGITFNASGPKNLILKGGNNYGGKTDLTSAGSLDAGVGDIKAGYNIFKNDGVNNVDFLLAGGGNLSKDDTRSLANTLITVAEERKDAVAFISPSRNSIISDSGSQSSPVVLDDETITNNIIDFFDPIASTTFAVFDSGYKYVYDRFNEVFRYIPLNGDIAGLCARNDINDFPWFSPAGTDRGAILNAVKLPYNPTRLQRDKLYSNRINPVINSPGAGIILFGDKTGFAKASAFDRINVRRLFIFLEQGIAAAAKDQLFEFNDEITRANFVNIVEPFLRDVQSKRGIQDYVVICDETNNTAAVIDSNEFIADIFIKPARSINFIGLTFVATRTGISFEEVIGSV